VAQSFYALPPPHRLEAVDRKRKTREIQIIYNFIGAFDFEAAMEKTAPPQKAVGAE
jgi:hypothetical protein